MSNNRPPGESKIRILKNNLFLLFLKPALHLVGNFLICVCDFYILMGFWAVMGGSFGGAIVYEFPLITSRGISYFSQNLLIRALCIVLCQALRVYLIHLLNPINQYQGDARPPVVPPESNSLNPDPDSRTGEGAIELTSINDDSFYTELTINETDVSESTP